MSLRGRLERLRTQARRRVHAQGMNCRVCGRDQHARLVALLEPGDEIGNCDACGGMLCPDGAPLGVPGGHVKIIELAEEGQEDELDEVLV